jgi:hypothetical protein
VATNAGRVLALSLAAALAACGGGQGSGVVKTSSAPRQPGWLARPPQEPGVLYFSGAREGADGLEEGKTAATDAARAQAAQFIGVNISAEHRDVQSTDLAQDQVKDTVSSQTAALIRSAQVADVYYEKISRQAGATSIDRYDVWVLIKLPKAELEAERQRQADEQTQAAKGALLRLREAQAQERTGNWLAALVRYRDVVATTRPMATSVDTGDKQLPNAFALRQAAEDAASKAQAKVRRAILVAPDWVGGALTQALSARGFAAQVRPGLGEQAAQAAARAEGIPWVIVAHAQTTPGGRVFALVAASASLDVRALDAFSGAVVASSQKVAKGTGRTPEAAAESAATEAGVGAGNDVAAALVAKESAGL